MCRMLRRAVFFLFVATTSLTAQQYGGLIGLAQRRLNKPPAPNTTVQLVAEEIVFSPDPNNHAAGWDYFLILSNGAKAIAGCSAPGEKQCPIQPFVAENRHSIACGTSGTISFTRCFPAETYKAYRSGNDLIVFSANGASYMSISGPWDDSSLSRTAKPSAAPVLWTAICNDDFISYSQERSGTCSDHQGVKQWRDPPKK
jgi:hypothetical protein